MNRLTRFSKPAGSKDEYIALADARADRAEARADKFKAERDLLVKTLRTLQARVDACELGPVNGGLAIADTLADECSASRALLRGLGEEA